VTIKPPVIATSNRKERPTKAVLELCTPDPTLVSRRPEGKAVTELDFVKLNGWASLLALSDTRYAFLVTHGLPAYCDCESRGFLPEVSLDTLSESLPTDLEYSQHSWVLFDTKPRRRKARAAEDYNTSS
jgi:hypothetical protein